MVVKLQNNGVILFVDGEIQGEHLVGRLMGMRTAIPNAMVSIDFQQLVGKPVQFRAIPKYSIRGKPKENPQEFVWLAKGWAFDWVSTKERPPSEVDGGP